MNALPIRRSALAALSFLLVLCSGSATAGFRAYLASTGTDNPTCVLTAPCRLLPAALTAVDFGGEIWMLDSANYNTSTVNITKSVTILSIPGVLGSVVGVNGSNAITIATPGVEVTLQNLNIRNINGDIGVQVVDAANVSIVNCVIFGFNNQGGVGVWVNPGTNAPKVNVMGSTIRNNFHGFIVAGNGLATLSRVQVLSNSQVGVWSNSGGPFGVSVIHVSDSVSSGNAHGFVATGGASGFASEMYVTRSIATENVVNGFTADGGNTVSMVVGESMATHNGNVGFFNSGTRTPVGNFRSRGDNTVSGNFNAQTSGAIQLLSGI